MTNRTQPKAVMGGTDVDDASTEDPVAPSELPLLPGTEQPRSLGEMMRDAELALGGTAAASQTDAGASTEQSRPRKVKKPSRAQSRRYARERALQALYQWDVSAAQSTTVRQEFLDTQDMSRVDVDYFVRLYNGVSHAPQRVDDALQPCLDRPMADLDPIERAVLRIAAFELSQQPDIPARVVINEGIEITKRFGADKGHTYVNGVLDKLAAQLRPHEIKAR